MTTEFNRAGFWKSLFETGQRPSLLARVAKCHGYDGYIRVKILAGWGKSFGEHANLAKSSLFGGKFVQH